MIMAKGREEKSRLSFLNLNLVTYGIRTLVHHISAALEDAGSAYDIYKLRFGEDVYPLVLFRKQHMLLLH
jgi:hypothetical protein